jgi:hypothetical protein
MYLKSAHPGPSVQEQVVDLVCEATITADDIVWQKSQAWDGRRLDEYALSAHPTTITIRSPTNRSKQRPRQQNSFILALRVSLH